MLQDVETGLGEVSMSLIISKFGGTSMGDATCMTRSAEVALAQKSRLVVVSATSGTTNDLIQIGSLSEKGLRSEAEIVIQKIQDRHLSIARDLKADQKAVFELQTLISEMDSIARGIFLLRDCSQKAKDVLMSLGERMSSLLFTQALQNVFDQNDAKTSRPPSLTARLLDVREVLKTDDNFGKAKPLADLIKKNCQEKLPNIKQDAKTTYVTQGFIGQTTNGLTTTLGRGGSDYSAALLAEALGADTVEIWTDVAGVATTDPRLCQEAVVINEISFQEMSELATFGAKVLHPATLLPAMRANIPVLVASSFEPDKPGTWVRREVKNNPLIRALALRRKQTLITISTPEMLHTHGFLYQIFKIFNDHQISIDAITTSEISVSVTIDQTENLSNKVLQDLSSVGEIQIEKNLCLVSLIGNNIVHTPGVAKNIFDAVSSINVRMICYGASRHNFCFLIEDEMGPLAIQRLHHQFIPHQ